MQTGDLMKAIATVIDNNKAALGIEGVSYPALPSVPKSPWVMVRESMTAPSRVTKQRAGVQVVLPAIDIVALVTSDIKRPQDASRLDGLKEPLLDLFDANGQGGNVNYAFTGILDDNVDRIWDDVTVRRTPMNWGEAGYCHALIMTLDSEFRRKAELP